VDSAVEQPSSSISSSHPSVLVTTPSSSSIVSNSQSQGQAVPSGPPLAQSQTYSLSSTSSGLPSSSVSATSHSAYKSLSYVPISAAASESVVSYASFENCAGNQIIVILILLFTKNPDNPSPTTTDQHLNTFQIFQQSQ
jgi:hypothetical protein